MALKKKPVTGMKDILPGEMEIRDYVLNIIKDTYRGYGFSAIETPCVEHIENLTSKQGGDNEKLIFKILKRGEKLNVEAAQTEADVVDGGLRYDLTLPLSRYYANNSANLSAPFKALQVGSVWRADRPQKGRFRQFVQCDIDILGDATNLAEIEEILALTKALKRICPDKAYTVRVNDRAILKGMADYSGFPENETDKVFIILDKMDKIGLDGVREELLAEGYAPEAVEKYTGLDFMAVSDDTEAVGCASSMPGSMRKALRIMRDCNAACSSRCPMVSSTRSRTERSQTPSMVVPSGACRSCPVSCAVNMGMSPASICRYSLAKMRLSRNG